MRTDGDDRLVGSWRRTGGAPCAADHAAHLRFEVNGLYFGTTEPPGGFTWWDGGSWRVSAPGRLELSTANDAVVTCTYSVDGATLSITDPAGCQVVYRRDG
jgi:hypothetical protein